MSKIIAHPSRFVAINDQLSDLSWTGKILYPQWNGRGRSVYRPDLKIHQTFFGGGTGRIGTSAPTVLLLRPVGMSPAGVDVALIHQGLMTFFICADADHILHRIDEDHPIACLARKGGFFDGIDGFL